LACDLKPLVAGRLLKQADDIVNELSGFDDGLAQLHLACLDLRQVKQVVEEREQGLAGIENCGGIVPAFGG